MQRFGKVIWKHLRGFFGPLAGLLGASWRPLGAPWRPSGGLLEAYWGLLALLEASWRPFGGFGVRLELTRNFGGLAFFGRAVVDLSWGRFFYFFQAIFESILRDFKQPSSQKKNAKSTIY